MLSVSPSIGLVAHVGPAGFGERAGWVPRDGVLGRPREAIATPIIVAAPAARVLHPVVATG